MSTDDLLVVDNLTLTLTSGSREKTLVRDLSFSLPEQQILGLIGESGSGKSMTCLAIMGLLPGAVRIKKGDIRFQGTPLTALSPGRFRAIRGRSLAMILQNPMSCFDGVFTIRHHFKETLLAHERVPKKDLKGRMLDALSTVGFEHPADILDLYPFQMSGGMLQRVMVALALLMDARLLIADEPTTDLDVVAQAKILSLLESVRDSFGMSILLVTHDLGVIARLCDHVAVMRRGEIVDRGTVSTLFQEQRHDYTRALMDAHVSLYPEQLQPLRTV